jgi:hypothetical protein
MKVAISIPDRIFKAAERTSHKLRISRSQLYSLAVDAYVRSLSGDEVTEQLNRVYGNEPSKMDPKTEEVTLEVLRRERWE